jgi:hypothetical protein
MLIVTVKPIMLVVVIVCVAALIGGTEPSKRKKNCAFATSSIFH